jgi:hypothetical protein
MESRALSSLTVALLFVVGTFATPIHLAVDAHEWDHHEAPKPDDHDHSHHESHPSTDHQLVPVSPVARPAPVVMETIALSFEVVTPEFQIWTLTVEAEANGPPLAPESPPKPSRAPPL